MGGSSRQQAVSTGRQAGRQASHSTQSLHLVVGIVTVLSPLGRYNRAGKQAGQVSRSDSADAPRLQTCAKRAAAALSSTTAPQLTGWGGVGRWAEWQHLEVQHFLRGGIEQLTNLLAAAADQ